MDGEVTAKKLNDMVKTMLGDMPHMRNLLVADRSANPYGVEMVTLAALMQVLHMAKDVGYGRSWSRHGEVGVYQNLVRKDDRLEQLALLTMSGHDDVTERHRIALVDTLIDRALYCMMWVSYIAGVRPEDFEAWLRDSWCRSTGIDFENVMEFIRRG